MNDALMQRLAPLVADRFPVLDGETLKEYGLRVTGSDLSEGQRAMIAADICAASDSLAKGRRIEKSAWIMAARLTFRPAERKPCIICGRYEGLTHAHHTVPLAVQFDAGAEAPFHNYDWLCPTHHTAIHLMISGLIGNVMVEIGGLPPEERDALDRLSVKFVDLLKVLPRWPARAA